MILSLISCELDKTWQTRCATWTKENFHNPSSQRLKIDRLIAGAAERHFHADWRERNHLISGIEQEIRSKNLVFVAWNEGQWVTKDETETRRNLSNRFHQQQTPDRIPVSDSNATPRFDYCKRPSISSPLFIEAPKEDPTNTAPVSVANLNKLVQILEGTRTFTHQLSEFAFDESDASATLINGALQVFLGSHKKNAKAYHSLAKLYGKSATSSLLSTHRNYPSISKSWLFERIFS
jgi:hypothetical protein